MKPLLRRHRTTSEIDITPFTDVILVLLIIFMLAMPVIVRSEYEQAAGDKRSSSQGGFEINLPKATSGQPEAARAPAIVALLEDGRIVFENKAVNETEIEARLEEVARSNPDAEIIIQADRMVPHWRVVRLMDLSAKLGLKRLSIATQKE